MHDTRLGGRLELRGAWGNEGCAPIWSLRRLCIVIIPCPRRHFSELPNEVLCQMAAAQPAVRGAVKERLRREIMIVDGSEYDQASDKMTEMVTAPTPLFTGLVARCGWARCCLLLFFPSLRFYRRDGCRRSKTATSACSSSCRTSPASAVRRSSPSVSAPGMSLGRAGGATACSQRAEPLEAPTVFVPPWRGEVPGMVCASEFRHQKIRAMAPIAMLAVGTGSALAGDLFHVLSAL